MPHNDTQTPRPQVVCHLIQLTIQVDGSVVTVVGSCSYIVVGMCVVVVHCGIGTNCSRNSHLTTLYMHILSTGCI